MADSNRAYALSICFIALSTFGTMPLVSGAHGSELRRTPTVIAVESNKGAIVNIQGRKVVRTNDVDPESKPVNGMGTGIVIDERGYILTNYHVVEGVAQIQVQVDGGETTMARLVSHDAQTDLAVIKISLGRELPTIRVGTSNDLMLGEPVIAVGNAFGYDNTITTGIISSIHRPVQVSDTQKYDDLIQTDASINPGNSGGPLLNIDGEMIGVNVAVRVGAQGIGFAIPADKAMSVAAHLMSAERLGGIAHGVVGVTKFAEGTSRFVVQSVKAGSPAEAAGLRSGDVITTAEDRPIANALDFERCFLGKKSTDEMKVAYLRGKSEAIAQLQPAAVESSQGTNDRVWEALGLKLSPINPQDFRRYTTHYRGGMRVDAVRANSPAAEQGIRGGDVLVGMHIWQTVSSDNVTYILNRPDFQDLQPVKFFILRGSETLYGYLQVTAER